MQHSVQYGSQAYGLGLDEKLVSEYLNEKGYVSHTVGKVKIKSKFKLNHINICKGLYALMNLEKKVTYQFTNINNENFVDNDFVMQV